MMPHTLWQLLLGNTVWLQQFSDFGQMFHMIVQECLHM